MNWHLKRKFNIKKAVLVFRHNAVPLTLMASCGLIALFGADRWILRNLEEQRNLNFKQAISRIALQLSENVLLENYNNIDTLLLRILDEDLHVTCLLVSDNNGKILSIASREQPGAPASIKYGKPPKKCQASRQEPNNKTIYNGNFYAERRIENNNLPLGYVTGHAVNDENDLALIRKIEIILFGAFGVAFLPAFGLLSWSSLRQLEIEQEKTARVSGLIKQLQEAQGRTHAAFEGTNDGWVEWNLQTNQCLPSLKMRRLLGIHKYHRIAQRANHSLSENWKYFIIKDDYQKFHFFLDTIKRKTGRPHLPEVSGIEVRIKPIGSEKIQTLKVEAVVTKSVNNEPSVIALVANNITRAKEQQQRINHLAFYDTLTGLRNRFSFEEELKNAVNGLNRNEYRLAIFAIDIDNFKFLNDSHGHAAGDQFLIQVANRIKSCLRANDFVARLGGDEFVIIFRLPYKSNSEIETLTKSIAGKLLAKLSNAFSLTNCTVYNTCSIGICIANTESKSTATLLDKADMALYKAKGMGRNCFYIYQAGMASALISKATTAERLRAFIDAGESGLFLQPIIRLDTNDSLNNKGQLRIAGYEALFRCPRLKNSIQYLISCAEEAGIINSITESILDGIKDELSKIRHNKNAYISINISPIQFLENKFPSKFLHQLRDRDINPERICIEITETAVLEDTNCALDHITSLQKEGIRFSLDDFGTGYASIELLRKLPFTYLKIDRTYIQNIHQESEIKLIKSIISMAKAFNMELIGEGVETIGQKTILESLGCEYAQGFLFNKDGSYNHVS